MIILLICDIIIHVCNKLHAHIPDISELDSFPGIVDEVTSIVGESGLSMLINNAGIVRRQMGLEDLYAEDVMEQFKLNAVAPLMLTKVGDDHICLVIVLHYRDQLPEDYFCLKTIYKCRK